MKYAVVVYLRRIIALLTSFFLMLCPVKENEEKPETARPANSVSAYDAAEADYLLTADASKEVHEISDLLFGAFFEDINFAGDGGLYAEMVANRSFEFTELAAGDGLFGYSAVNGAVLSLTKDADQALNGNNPTFVTVTNPAEGPAGIANRGFMEGMAIKKGESYRFSVYAKSDDYAGPLTVRLTADGDVAASSTIPSVTEQWQKYIVTLACGRTATDNVAIQVLIGQGSVDLDMVSLFPVHTFNERENGLRKDMVEALAAMQPKFLRFPGGCVIEGESDETAYHWKDSIGVDADGEPLLFNGAYGDVAVRKQGIDLWTDLGASEDPYPSFMSYGLGFYEFFQLCEDIGAAPVPVLTAGLYCQMRGRPAVDMDSDEFRRDVQDMLDLIEFANGDTSTKWGAVRASMGHPAPFGLTMVAVGNENEGPVYYERYTAFLDALHEAQAAHPEIYGGVEMIYSSGASDGLGGGMYLPSYQYAKDRLNGSEDVSSFAAATDHHYYQSPEWLLQNADYYDEENYSRTVSHMTDTVYGGAIPVFLGEYAGRSNTLYAALAEAAYMTGLERNGDIVKMASYAPLFSSLTARHWAPNLIWFNNEKVEPSVNYEVQKLFSTNTGCVLLKSTLSGADVPQETLSGRVGVGAWYTEAEFDNLLVVNASTGKTILKDSFTVSDFRWNWENPNEGNFKIADGVLRHEGTEMNYSDIGDVAYYGTDNDMTNYVYTIDAKKTAGEEGFLLPLAVHDKDNCYFWNLGGWGNTVSCLQKMENGVKTGQILKTVSEFVVETGRTYHLKIVVSGTKIKCFVDGEQLIDYDTSHPDEAEAYQVVSKTAEGDIIVKLVNVTEQKKTFAVKMKGVDMAESTVVYSALTGGSMNAEKGEMSTGELKIDGSLFNLTVAPRSVTVIRIKQ
ncbi:MAG: hypothetical protein IJK89_02680 [Clostridia bacterium]|nr:hypothetical protein [Clostridia bacterium]